MIEKGSAILITDIHQAWFDLVSGLVQARLELKNEVERLGEEKKHLVAENKTLRQKLNETETALAIARDQAGLSAEAQEIAGSAKAVIDGVKK